MTKTSQELLHEKIAQCAKALADLQRYRAIGTLSYLREHPDIYYAVCYRFVSVIEALFDAAQVVLSSRGQRATGESDIATLLARENILSDDLASRFSSMYGFRNRLVHAYGTLDDAKVASYLSERLDDVEALLAVFQKSAKG